MKKSFLLLTASLLAVCAISFAGCMGKNGESSTIEKNNRQSVTIDEIREEPAEDCPDQDCKPDDGNCKDGKCGKKRMPRTRRDRNKIPTRENCEDDDCKDGETREFDRIRPRRPHRRCRKPGQDRIIPDPTEPINEVKPKTAD